MRIKKCKKNQVYNRSTKRCRKRCLPHQRRSPYTQRCINRSRKRSQRLKQSSRRVSRSLSTRNRSRSSRQVSQSLSTRDRSQSSRRVSQSLFTRNRSQSSRRVSQSLSTRNRSQSSRRVLRSLATRNRSQSPSRVLRSLATRNRSHEQVKTARIVCKVIDIPGDGNCLYRALSYFQYKNQQDYARVRNEIVDFVRNKYDLSDTKLDDHIVFATDAPEKEYRNWGNWVEEQVKDGVWGDFLTLELASRLYKTNIKIYNENNVIIYKTRYQSPNEWTLQYVGNNHYNVLECLLKPSDAGL